jgi:hypothetical protein
VIAVELPRIAHVADHVEIEIADDDVVGGAGGAGEDLAARVAEVALAVEFADAPRLFPAGTIDRADKVTVGDGVGGLFQLPEIFGQAGDRRRRILLFGTATQAGALRSK